MELVIYQPTESEFIKSIEFNHEELKQQLAEALVKYEGLTYSDSNIKSAKADRANLNKFKEAMETRRKEIKKACLAPYEAFEAKVKELVAMVDKPIMAIDAQVKTYEQMLKDEKLEGIKQVYADRVGDLAQLVPFDRIYNPRWLNATYKGTEIEKEIIALFARIENDLRVIAELQSEYELQIKDTYLKNFDLTAALQEKTRLEEQAAKMAEYKRIQAERQAQIEADRKAATEVKPQPKAETVPTIPEPAKTEPEPKQPEPEKAESVYEMDFRVWGTKGQIMALRQYLQNSGIKYGSVPKPQ